MYPSLGTLRIQGGEVFALKGFRELLEDVKTCVDRPIVSISTNGTLMNEEWCNRMIDTPFQTVTISIDAAKPETFERIRQGARLETVISNIKLLQRLKKERNSWYPNLDVFFVIMRSNFREIPEFLAMLLELEIYEVSFQTLLIDDRNIERSPNLQKDELICEEAEIRELHALLKEVVREYGGSFDRIAWSGLNSMFDPIGLDSTFLDENKESLYPTQDRKRKERKGPKAPVPPRYDLPALPESYAKTKQKQGQCPNPWTTIFVTENGDVSLCFLASPIGNLYETPLIELWNSPQAIAKRSRMLAGNYTQSGCSRLYCDWRDGKVSAPPDPQAWRDLLSFFNQLVAQLDTRKDNASEISVDNSLRAIRRMLGKKNARIKELEANLKDLWSTNGLLHQTGKEQLTKLEGQVKNLRKQIDLKKQEKITQSKSPVNSDFGKKWKALLGYKETEERVYCAKPFQMLEVHEGGSSYLCCPSWCDMKLGSPNGASFLDMWNGPKAQEYRKSILDGSFRHCKKDHCPHLESRTGAVGSLKQLEIRGFSERIIEDLKHESRILDHGPIAINCCYDRSCTLACPSCRDKIIMHKGEKLQEIKKLQDRLRKEIMRDAEHLFITGSGDPFGSSIFREWLQTMTGVEAAALKNVHLMTNAQLLNQEMWNSLNKAARESINSLEISIDAASKVTYHVNRKNGKWDKLLANLGFISQLRKQGDLKNVRISMVVQKNNFMEMSAFIQLAERFAFDHIFFSKILNWFPEDKKAELAYLDKAVHLPEHPWHSEFLKTVQSIHVQNNPKVILGNLMEYAEVNAV
jgi:MoaA/NifB/PqqE/SkfB family radical SAM enzyme